MARSHKPLLWLPFAAGGTVAALALPGLVLVALLSALGWLPDGALAHGRLHAFAGHWLGALVLLGGLGAMVWHAAHRLRMTVQDLGVWSPAGQRLAARVCYGLAALVSVALVVVLIRLIGQ